MPSATPSQKSVLVTGCSAGGIGSSLALSFATRDHLVFATARNVSKISPSLAAHPNVRVLTLDTTSSASITAAVEEVGKVTGGTLNYLVNNAGQGLVSPFLDTDMQKARDLFEVNFWGVLGCIQGFKKLLVEGRGCVVNVASISAVAMNPYESIYNASKAALAHFTSTISIELRPLGVTTVTVMAGMVQSVWYSNSVPPFVLPEDSYYRPVVDAINDGLQGADNKKNGMDVDIFAENVVKQVVRGQRGRIWAGALSGLVKWTTAWMPGWVLEKICWDRGNLGKLASERKKAEKA
ncbi:putative short-chain dehydrogenase/reductase [Melanomma pulvis-pyrius CBS 109.77]|uniref:Putative short-chain dehydrogenase/reductase n=1 Tax=Melanomma pulvis-pyrius CBS 109.77 TaxID=1314802 RepID=A0A6A6WPT6_9PLEO|nr:putative short-chain dehydrogenase/reductase [Melanomma pulvis-pyrius CBS 109.77]